MNCLLIGGGGREHALAWKMKKSPLLKNLHLVPGNPGMSEFGQCHKISLDDHAALIELCLEHAIDLVVVGPEVPLVAGIADVMRTKGISVFGPSRAAAALEGSKSFTKELCSKANIPTARSQSFSSMVPAMNYLEQHSMPCVIKADGLAAGKGVVIAKSLQEAKDALKQMFSGRFGVAGTKVVIEEFLTGEEASLFAICDGTVARFFAGAQDHKRLLENDLGPNTGGMGAYSPAPVLSKEVIEQAMSKIVNPTLEYMAKSGIPFVGTLFAGLMITEDGPKLIEYNVRFGDPECQVMLPLLKSDIVEIMHAACTGQLQYCDMEFTDQVAVSVVVAAEGYPEQPVKGGVVHLPESLDDSNTMILHAGTALNAEGELIANGGRVLNIVGLGKDLQFALGHAYNVVDKIKFENKVFRRDIGWRALSSS